VPEPVGRLGDDLVRADEPSSPLDELDVLALQDGDGRRLEPLRDRVDPLTEALEVELTARLL
jgi:hypothetical protein